MNRYINIFEKEIKKLGEMRIKLYETYTNDYSETNEKDALIHEIEKHLANILLGNVSIIEFALDEFEQLLIESKNCIDNIKYNKENQ